MVSCSANGCNRGSGAAWIFRTAAVQEANKSGIDLIVLGPLQVEFGVGADLSRLEHHDHKPLAPQFGYDRLFVPAACLDADAFNALLSQPRQQRLVTFRRVLHLQLLAAAVDCHIKLPFAGIDPGTGRAMLGHLRRSLPCDANLKFVQPFGSR
jgi:hypothetical protein